MGRVHGVNGLLSQGLYFVLLMKSHLQSYPCPLQINFFWNLGFLLGVAIMLQIVTGIFLALHYTSDLHSAYFSVFFLIREVYYGWCLRYFRSSGASFVFLFLFLHLGRAIFYNSYFYNPNLVFWNCSSLLLNGYSIYGLCVTFWTNEFLGSYSNYKFIISFSIFNRMGLWRILYSQSNIEEVLSLSFSIAISSLWFYNSSFILSSFSFF